MCNDTLCMQMWRFSIMTVRHCDSWSEKTREGNTLICVRDAWKPMPDVPCIVCVPNALATKLCHTHTQVSHACFTGIHDIYCIKISWVLCKQTSSICMKAFFSAFVDCMPQQESVCVWTLRPCWSPWAQKLAQVLQSDAEKHITWIHTKRQVIVWCLGHSQRYEVWQVIRLGKPNCLLRLLPVFTRTCCKIST